MLMVDVFDLPQVALIRVEGRTFECVTHLPLPDPDTRGEVREGGPRDPLSNLPWSEMRIPIPIWVELPVRWVPSERTNRSVSQATRTDQ